ncbi:MAG: hypothetical protein HOQ41_20390 [Ensifer adhaerens]|nr:hypothetical protein [Ensifer adhaerens]
MGQRIDPPYSAFDSAARNDRPEFSERRFRFRVPIGSDVVEAGYALVEPWKSLLARHDILVSQRLRTPAARAIACNWIIPI